MNTIVVYFVISMLCNATIFANYFAWKNLRGQLAKALSSLRVEQMVYMAHRRALSRKFTRFGLVVIFGSLIASLFGSTQWSTIGLALGTICFAMSWHNTTVMSSRLKTMVAGGKRGDQ